MLTISTGVSVRRQSKMISFDLARAFFESGKITWLSNVLVLLTAENIAEWEENVCNETNEITCDVFQGKDKNTFILAAENGLRQIKVRPLSFIILYSNRRRRRPQHQI